MTIQEVDYVEYCPACDCVLMGMSPDEYREEHLPKCTEPELGMLSVFPTPEERRRLRNEGRLAGYSSSKEDKAE